MGVISPRIWVIIIIIILTLLIPTLITTPEPPSMLDVGSFIIRIGFGV